MKQWRIEDAWNYDGLRLGDAPAPEPGPGEVLLRLSAVSLNYRDHLMVTHGYGRLSGALPLVPLSDGVGEVVAVGDGVDATLAGRRLLPCFNQAWLDGDLDDALWAGLLGGPLDGTAREFMCARADACVAVPDHLSDVEAATLGCAAITAWNALAEMPAPTPGATRAGGTVLTQGTGGVSLFALQFAKSLGHHVIATSSSPAKLERLIALGADAVIDYTAQPDWGKAAVALTDGRGVDLVVEVGGAGTLKQSLRAVRSNGTIASVGNVAGSVAEINLPLLFMFRKRLVGIATGSVSNFRAMMAHVERTAFRPVLDDAVPDFDGLKAALQALPEGRHFGKVAVRVG